MNWFTLNPPKPSPVSFHIFSQRLGVKVGNRKITPTLGLFNDYLEETFHRFKIENYDDIQRHWEVIEKYSSHSKYQAIKEDFGWVAEVHKMIFFYKADVSIFNEPGSHDFSHCFRNFLTKVIENDSELILPDDQLIRI